MRILFFLFLFIGLTGSTWGQNIKYKVKDRKDIPVSDKEIDSIINASVIKFIAEIGESTHDKEQLKIYFKSNKDNFSKEVWEVVVPSIAVGLSNYKTSKKAKEKEIQVITKYLAEATIDKMVIIKDSLAANVSEDKISAFRSSFYINSDGRMRVVETITIQNGETGTINKGIIRYIPEKYTIGYGLNFDMLVKIDSVLLDNSAVIFNEEFSPGNRVLYIGNPDVDLSFGTHVYKIIYTVSRPFAYGDGYDELYWNVNGNGWEFDIDSISCVVNFPDGATVNSFSCYTGKYGDTAKDCNGMFDEKTSRLVFSSNVKMLKNEGLTIACSIPEGIIKRESNGWIIFSSNLGPFFMIVAALLLLIRNIIIKYWRKYKESNKGKINVIPEFSIPDTINPALAGYLYHKGYEPSQTIASLVNLAVNKYITVAADGNADGSYLISATDKVFSSDKERELMFSDDAEILVSGHIKPGAANAEMAYFDRQVQWYCAKQNNKGLLFSYKKAAQWWGTGFIWFSLLLGILFMFMHYKPTELTFLYFAIGVVLCFLVQKLLDLRHTVYSKTGEELLNKVLGLRMFLVAADAQRMNSINKPNADFVPEKMLPYAIALDCVGKWTEAFGNSIQKSLEAGSNAADTMVNSIVYSTGGYYTLSSGVRKSWGVDYSNFYERRLREITEEIKATNGGADESSVKKQALTIFRHSNDKAAAEMLKKRVAELQQLVSIKEEAKRNAARKNSASTSSTSSTYKTSSKSSSKSGSSSRGSGYSGGGRGGGGGGGW